MTRYATAHGSRRLTHRELNGLAVILRLGFADCEVMTDEDKIGFFGSVEAFNAACRGAHKMAHWKIILDAKEGLANDDD